VTRELEKCKLDSVGVQEVRWDRGALSEQGIILIIWKRKLKSSTANRIFLHHRKVSRIVEFVSDKMSYIVL